MRREYKVEANQASRRSRIARSISVPSDVDSKFVRQTGGKGQYGPCRCGWSRWSAARASSS